jgi:hypothetical protein
MGRYVLAGFETLSAVLDVGASGNARQPSRAGLWFALRDAQAVRCFSEGGMLDATGLPTSL